MSVSIGVSCVMALWLPRSLDFPFEDPMTKLETEYVSKSDDSTETKKDENENTSFKDDKQSDEVELLSVPQDT